MVGPDETDLKTGKISVDSPVGRALLPFHLGAGEAPVGIIQQGGIVTPQTLLIAGQACLQPPDELNGAGFQLHRRGAHGGADIHGGGLQMGRVGVDVVQRIWQIQHRPGARVERHLQQSLKVLIGLQRSGKVPKVIFDPLRQRPGHPNPRIGKGKRPGDRFIQRRLFKI
ncbi:MAG: GreA/GreB family elongation factor [Planctomycetes bacterium]|nr:GreA/GreB family elongation factor [Planctomycetota bacterium]